MADDMNMTTSQIISDLARLDRDDKTVTRFGLLPFILRQIDGGWMVEDTRCWNPEVASFPDRSDAILMIANLVADERKAV